jgi:hypothetical protein
VEHEGLAAEGLLLRIASRRLEQAATTNKMRPLRLVKGLSAVGCC